jgi:hypothetical protein
MPRPLCTESLPSNINSIRQKIEAVKQRVIPEFEVPDDA